MEKIVTMDFSSKGAAHWAEQGNLDEWVDAFLRGEGKNIELADGLRKEKRYWTKLMVLPTSVLKRVCGPEPEMEYVESQAGWDKRVDALVSSIRTGHEFAPLIVEFKDGALSIRDGSHRYAAYVKEGMQTCPVVIWFNQENDRDEFMKRSL